MTILILIGVIPAMLGLVAWFWLLVWGARKDGEFQRSHEPGGSGSKPWRRPRRWPRRQG